MSFNYRVIRKIWPIFEDLTEPEVTYRIHEVYYKDGVIDGYTRNAVYPLGETLEELNRDICAFIRATVLPVLEEINGKLVEVEE